MATNTPNGDTDPLDGKTFFTILVRWKGEVRPFTLESGLLESDDEVIQELAEHRNAFAVFRHDPDVPRAHVSEDIARKWWAELSRKEIPENIPPFILEHLSDDQLFGRASAAA